jgi:hypothetical protein
MTIDSKLARGRRERRRRQLRRRRAIALLAASSLLLALAFAVAGVPAQATSASEAPAGGSEPSAPAGEATPECVEGTTEGGVAIRACEPPAEGEPSEEEASGEEPSSEENPAEEPRAEEPPATEPPTEGPPATEPEATGTATEAGTAPTAAEPPQPQAAQRGGRRHAPAAHAGAPLGQRRSHRGAGAQGGRSAAAGAHGHRGRGTGRSGGTAAPPLPPRRRLRWTGPWAIPSQIVACESGGDYGALNPSSGAGGAYQILPSTWRAYGGAGQPQTAPPAEQDRIAAQIWATAGPSAWVCAQGGSWEGAGLPGALGPLPDPLPPAARLDRSFASLLIRTARVQHVDWALLLAVARLRGGHGPDPAAAVQLHGIAARVAGLGPTRLPVQARALSQSGRAAQRLVALTRYDRAVGLRGLVEGLDAVKDQLAERVLSSPRFDIYAGGRADVEAGNVDVRVLTLLLYLAQGYRSVTVSCLISDHGFLTSAGRPSLHAFGRAVDISALNGTPVLGHQQPGGVVEHALRRILLLPRPLQPSELISLFELGGPSFALPDHADHIHAGF